MSLRAPVYSLRSRFAAAPRVRLFDVVCAVALSTIVSAGCESNSSSSSGSAGSKAAAKAEASAASAADARCQQLLSSGLDMMRPESLGITAQEQQAVDSLNNWAGDCGKSTAANDPAPKNGRRGRLRRFVRPDRHRARSQLLAGEAAGGGRPQVAVDRSRPHCGAVRHFGPHGSACEQLRSPDASNSVRHDGDRKGNCRGSRLALWGTLATSRV